MGVLQPKTLRVIDFNVIINYVHHCPRRLLHGKMQRAKVTRNVSYRYRTR